MNVTLLPNKAIVTQLQYVHYQKAERQREREKKKLNKNRHKHINKMVQQTIKPAHVSIF